MNVTNVNNSASEEAGKDDNDDEDDEDEDANNEGNLMKLLNSHQKEVQLVHHPRRKIKRKRRIIRKSKLVKSKYPCVLHDCFLILRYF